MWYACGEYVGMYILNIDTDVAPNVNSGGVSGALGFLVCTFIASMFYNTHTFSKHLSSCLK